MMILILGFLAVLIAIMAVMDLQARRHGRRLHVDGGTARDEQRKNEADLRTRSNRPDLGGFSGTSGF